MGDIKNILSSFEIPSRTKKIWDCLFADPKNTTLKPEEGTLSNIFKESALLVNNVYDGLSYVAEYVVINKETIRYASGINSLATIGGCGTSALEHISKLRSGKANDPTYSTVLLARDLSYVAVGAIGIYTFATGATVAPWKILACITSGLTFSITGHFYNQMRDPEDKGRDSMRVQSTIGR